MIEHPIGVKRIDGDECAPYLKDGESHAECIVRNRRDIDTLLTLLAREKARMEAAMSAVRLASEALAKHDEWCGYRKQAPGHSSFLEAQRALRLMLGGDHCKRCAEPFGSLEDRYFVSDNVIVCRACFTEAT